MTVRVVAFVNEEPPFSFSPVQGSYVNARAARERGDDIDLVHQEDSGNLTKVK